MENAYQNGLKSSTKFEILENRADDGEGKCAVEEIAIDYHKKSRSDLSHMSLLLLLLNLATNHSF